MKSCKDCIHYEKENICIRLAYPSKYGLTGENCKYFKDKSKIVELPFIAMIEQFIKNGKFDKRNTTHNGKYAVVYMDKSKWGIPIIDITSKYYNAEEAEKALKEYNDQLR